MQKIVLLDAKEWESLPARLAKALYEQSLGPGGFTVVSKGTGEPIVDRLKDWLCGTLVVAFGDVVERVEA